MPVIYPVAGGKGGIGKSFITANLGYLLAKEGKKVLLSDFDLGSANLHSMLGMKNPDTGLSHFLDKTSPDLMDTIVSCQNPGLFLLNAQKCGLEAANLPYAQVQKIINAISRLSYDLILLDLGAGTHFNTLDFLLTSTNVIMVFTPEPTSIESGVRFIETVYFRALKKLLKQQRMNAILKSTGTPFALSLSEIVNTLVRETDDDGPNLLQCLGNFSFKLIINQARSQDSLSFGTALLKMFRRHFYSSFELIGILDYDEKILDAISSKQLYAKKFPRSRTTHDLTKIAKRIVSVNNAPAHAPVRIFSTRNYYELLDIQPDATLSEVQKAHQTTLDLYRNNPKITDALFSIKEINNILEKIDSAAQVLINPNKRREYDASLFINKPENEKNYAKSAGSRETTIGNNDDFDRKEGRIPSLQTKAKKNPETQNLIEKLNKQPVISGWDLKALRTASGFTIETIFEKTRVGISILKDIEEDRFDALPPMIYLKGFLKAYARELQLPPGAVVDGYLKNIEKKDRYRPERPNG